MARRRRRALTPGALLRRRARGERGAAAVELAFLLPVLIVLLFGIVEFARAYNVKVQMTHAAREGARAVAVGAGPAAAAVATALPNLSGVDVSGPASCSGGQPVTVTLSYQHTIDIPLWGEQPVTLTSKGVMRCAEEG